MWGLHSTVVAEKQEPRKGAAMNGSDSWDAHYAHRPDEPAPAPLVLNDKELDQLFWQQNTEALLFAQDQAAWGAGVLFLCFIITVMDFDPAFIICGIQMVTQLVLMLRFPASYKANRDIICLAIRVWRAYVTFRLCSNFVGPASVTKPLLRSLLVASGALINFVVAIGYQLKFSVHLKVQIMAVAISILSGTRNVAAFVTREEHLAAITRLYESFSTVSSTLLEGINFPGHRSLGCNPNPGVALVLMAQLYLGFLAPTYTLYILERTCRQRFKARILAAGRPCRAPPSAFSLDACCMALFAGITHLLVLAVAAAVMWEAICCGTWALQHPSPSSSWPLTRLSRLSSASTAWSSTAQARNTTH